MAQPVTWQLQQRDAAWVTQTLAPGPNGKRFDGVGAAAELAAAPTGAISMYDSITPQLMPKGAPAYAFYADGTYADLGAEASFPGATYVSIAIVPTVRAMYLDIEPGNWTASALPGFIKAGGLGFYASPGAGAGFSVRDCINALTTAGITRSEYRIWSAHWIGRHVCGPTTCGYPQADGTQYVATAAWDESVIDAPGFFGFGTFPIRAGATGPVIIALQAMINSWASRLKMAAPLTVDGSFGPLTSAAVVAARAFWGLAGTAGQVDLALWTHLGGSPVPPPPPPPPPVTVMITETLPVLREGATGAHVRWVQAVLSGFYGQPLGTPDGIFGAKTLAALTAVQKAHAVSDGGPGIIGVATWTLLASGSA